PSHPDDGHAVAIDDTGDAIVTGFTNSSDFPTTPGAFDPSYNGGGYYGDVFVAKLNAAGSELDYATFLGGSDDEEGHAVAVDGTGRAIVTGYTYSSDFPTTPGAFDTSYNGGYDAFVARLNAAGSALDYATFLGGSGSDCGNAVAVDEAGRATVTGWTTSSDFPTTPGAFDRNFNGGDDAFISKLDLEEPTAVTLAALQASNGGIPSVSIWLLMALLALALSIGAALTPRQTNASTGRRSTKAA
ncbi:MAG: hypothetical protein KDI03_21000, partial [Anaerolineae bacterium]|nr:hypothetical protein [Anaerolineae bacterium]